MPPTNPKTETSATAASSRNLISAWRLLLVKQGKQIKDGLDEMNAALGATYRHYTISRWESDKVTPSAEALNFMLRQVLPELCAERGLTRELGEELADLVRIPGGR